MSNICTDLLGLSPCFVCCSILRALSNKPFGQQFKEVMQTSDHSNAVSVESIWSLISASKESLGTPQSMVTENPPDCSPMQHVAWALLRVWARSLLNFLKQHAFNYSIPYIKEHLGCYCNKSPLRLTYRKPHPTRITFPLLHLRNRNRIETWQWEFPTFHQWGGCTAAVLVYIGRYCLIQKTSRARKSFNRADGSVLQRYEPGVELSPYTTELRRATYYPTSMDKRHHGV